MDDFSVAQINSDMADSFWRFFVKIRLFAFGKHQIAGQKFGLVCRDAVINELLNREAVKLNARPAEAKRNKGRAIKKIRGVKRNAGSIFVKFSEQTFRCFKNNLKRRNFLCLKTKPLKNFNDFLFLEDRKSV